MSCLLVVDDLSDVGWNEKGASGSSKRLGAMFGGRNKLSCLRCRDRGADVVHVGDAVGSAGVAGSRRGLTDGDARESNDVIESWLVGGGSGVKEEVLYVESLFHAGEQTS